MIEVMVVEDDPMVMELTCDYVDSIDGFHVVERARSGRTALAAINGENCIDLIILDIYMPIMNGVEFLTALRAKGNAADVIFLTASNDNRMIDSALKLGAVDYLIKPFKYDRFKESLDQYARRHELLKNEGKSTQDQVDSILEKRGGADKSGGQKGLHPKTLQKVRDYLRDSVDDAISQTDMARELGLSNVTVRRYMDYLTREKAVVLEVEYGSIGRPRYSYRKIK